MSGEGRRNRIGGAACGLLLLGLALTGCGQPKQHERLNTPPQGERDNKSRHQAFYKAMSDNALLSEMALYDMHFVSHQPLLSKAGETRVKRYAALLKETGGTLAYEPRDPDEKLDAARLTSIRKCLAEANAAGTKIEVTMGMNAAPGTDANQAMAARRYGTALPKPKNSVPTGGGSSSTGDSGAGGASGAAPSGGGKE